VVVACIRLPAAANALFIARSWRELHEYVLERLLRRGKSAGMIANICKHLVSTNNKGADRLATTGAHAGLTETES
jgi:hypothetical protein